jgi:hypothetical protein
VAPSSLGAKKKTTDPLAMNAGPHFPFGLAKFAYAGTFLFFRASIANRRCSKKLGFSGALVAFVGCHQTHRNTHK